MAFVAYAIVHCKQFFTIDYSVDVEVGEVAAGFVYRCIPSTISIKIVPYILFSLDVASNEKRILDFQQNIV